MTKDKVVLITGSSRGLGRETALLFGRKGYNVIVNYHKSRVKAEEVVDEIGKDKALSVQADVRDKDQVKVMIDEALSVFGKIDILVNNALINFAFNPEQQAPVEELTWDDYEEQFKASIQSSLNTVQAVLPSMKEENYGRIINIGTNLFQNPVVTYHEYTTSKAALLGFTRNMAKELGPYSIAVNMVSGGMLDRTDASQSSDEAFQKTAEASALKRTTAPRDVAEVVVFLGSEASRGVTGQNIVVDSGFTMN